MCVPVYLCTCRLCPACGVVSDHQIPGGHARRCPRRQRGRPTGAVAKPPELASGCRLGVGHRALDHCRGAHAASHGSEARRLAAPQHGDRTAQKAAEKGGIKPGDVIVSLNEKEIVYFKDLQHTVGRTKPGTMIKVKLLSGNSRIYSYTNMPLIASKKMLKEKGYEVSISSSITANKLECDILIILSKYLFNKINETERILSKDSKTVKFIEKCRNKCKKVVS